MFGFDDILDWLTPIVDTAADVVPDVVGDVLPEIGLDNAGDWFLDTATGEIVSAADMQAISDATASAGGGEAGDILGPPNYDWNAAAAGETGPGFATPGQIEATTPYNASTPFGLSSLIKPLASGLSSALKGFGGSAGTAEQRAKDEALVGSSGPGVGLAAPPGGGGGAGMTAGGGFGWGGGLTSLPGMGLGAPGQSSTQDAISALLSRLQAEGGPRVGMQAPIPMEAPVKFTPLGLPGAGGGGIPMARPEAAPMSALQRLLAERRG